MISIAMATYNGEIPQGKTGIVQTILERVSLNDNETKFLKKAVMYYQYKATSSHVFRTRLFISSIVDISSHT